MSSSGPDRPSVDHGAEAVDQVAQWLRIAGARPAPRDSLLGPARAALEREWAAVVRRRRAARHWRQGLAAGVAVLAIGLVLYALRRAPEPVPRLVATIIETRGAVELQPTGDHALITAGDTITAGSRLMTGSNGAALLRIGSVGLRAGADTLLEFDGGERLQLLRGRLYVDTGARSQGAALLVVTAFGTISHLGTRYQVQLEPGQFMVASVRDGRVRVDAFGRTQTIGSGEGLKVAADRTVTRLLVPADDARWQWVSELVPEFSIEGRTLSAFLDWFARETGRTLAFTPPLTRADTDGTVLNGSISGLTPAQALDAVTATTRFHCDLSRPGVLRISARADRGDSMPGHARKTAATTSPAR